MKKALKSIIRFFGKVYKLLRWCLLYVFVGRKSLPKFHTDSKRVLVLGNGPSVNAIDPQAFSRKGFDFLCVNFFACDREKFTKYKPRYYCLLDREYYLQLAMPESKRIPRANELLSCLESVDWPMTIIMFKNDYQFSNRNIGVVYINGNELNETWPGLEYKLYKSNKATYGYQNVILGALYFLITGGVTEIALIGVENDWHRELYVDKNNDVWRDDRHFYGVDQVNVTQAGEIEKHHLYMYFYYYYVTLRNYYYASLYANRAGVAVTNITDGSYIDVFPGDDWQEYLKKQEKDDIK